jgi:hypothetical protein
VRLRRGPAERGGRGGSDPGPRRDALHHYEQALADSERMLGLDHPMTRTVPENLEAVTKT